jgi:bacteriocin biosynthesis cyclodehydratase domain-containing protein
MAEEFHGLEAISALPVQLIPVDGGAIVKRGCTELKVSGHGAFEAASSILERCGAGGASRQDLCALFPEEAQAAAEQLIDLLLQRRFLISAGAEASPLELQAESHLEIFYWHFGLRATDAQAHLRKFQLAILGVNAVSRQLVHSLERSGFTRIALVDLPALRNLRLFDMESRLLPDEWEGCCTTPIPYQDWIERTTLGQLDCIVATSDFGAGEPFRSWNRFCMQHKCLFFPVVLQNMVGQVGPMVIPGETACYQCLEDRRNSNAESATLMQAVEDKAFEGQLVNGFHPSMASIVGDLAAIELTKFCCDALPKQTVGTLIEVNLLATRLKARKVLKVPRCPVCSPLLARSSAAASRHEAVPEPQAKP